MFELLLGSGKGLRKERDEREEASEREGFEDTNIVRCEQDMVSEPFFFGALQKDSYGGMEKKKKCVCFRSFWSESISIM